MAPGLITSNHDHLLYNDDHHEDVVDDDALDLSLSSAMAFYPYPYMPILDNTNIPFNFIGIPFSDETTRDHKRMKTTISSSNSDSSESGAVSPVSLPRLQFRDHIWSYTQRYLASEAVDEAAAATSMSSNNIVENEAHDDQHRGADGMRLVQLLIACAEAVACRDKSHASALLSELRSNALVFGSSFQRVASCFVQGLADRLSLVQPLGTVGFVSPAMNMNMNMNTNTNRNMNMNMIDIGCDKKEEAVRLVYELCPHIQFGHFVANSAILEAFEGESNVHVVDLGMSLGSPQGHQWCQLVQSLASRSGPPVNSFRITAVGVVVKKFRIIGEELEAYAKSVGIKLEFSVIESILENLDPKDIKTFEGEVVVVNSVLQLHRVVKESRGALNSVLQIIHELSPKILVLVEQDSSHNGPFFLGRFMEALHYYSAIFDSLDSVLPKYDTRRAKIEQFYFAEEIKNIVSCEGPARVERHERVDQWRRRMSRAGFQCLAMKMLAQGKQWLAKKKVCDGYTVVEEKGCLILGWKSKPIIAVSCWKC